MSARLRWKGSTGLCWRRPRRLRRPRLDFDTGASCDGAVKGRSSTPPAVSLLTVSAKVSASSSGSSGCACSGKPLASLLWLEMEGEADPADPTSSSSASSVLPPARITAWPCLSFFASATLRAPILPPLSDLARSPLTALNAFMLERSEPRTRMTNLPGPVTNFSMASSMLMSLRFLSKRMETWSRSVMFASVFPKAAFFFISFASG
mmetsp:Transcript_3223/g.9327  ORF Transcript_3223/g.9327 Transcript_3223/m.9327 type:complete len:207 (-) Transcript_3223:4968-5588(-)